MNFSGAELAKVWRRLSWPDVAAMALVALGTVATLVGLNGGTYSFLKFLSLLSVGYLPFRLIVWGRSRLLWSLRNRLIVAGLFLALAPVLLLVTLAALAGQILYSQLGGYILFEDIHGRLARMADSAASLAAAEKTLPATIPDKVVEEVLDAQIRVAYSKDLPGLKIDFHADPRRLSRIARPNEKEFTGIVQSGGELHLIGLRDVESQRRRNVMELRPGVAPDFLETVAPDLGPIQVTALQKASDTDVSNTVPLAGTRYRFIERISTRHRKLHAASYWFDPTIEGFSKL